MNVTSLKFTDAAAERLTPSIHYLTVLLEGIKSKLLRTALLADHYRRPYFPMPALLRIQNVAFSVFVARSYIEDKTSTPKGIYSLPGFTTLFPVVTVWDVEQQAGSRYHKLAMRGAPVAALNDAPYAILQQNTTASSSFSWLIIWTSHIKAADSPIAM